MYQNNITNYLSFEATVEDTSIMIQKNSNSRKKLIGKVKNNEANVSEDYFNE